MKDSDYELYETNFEEWLRIGREQFGLEDHPGSEQEVA